MKVIGTEGLIFGDLHISDCFEGRHINYLANCFGVLSTILKICREKKPKYVIFLGDLVGQKEKQIRRRPVLLQLCSFFKELNAITNGNVYSLRGNHDMGEFPEFEFLSGLGYIKTSKDVDGYLDVYPTEESDYPEVRFHLVDYGCERQPIRLKNDTDTSNVVLAHNNFTIASLTNWYNDHDGIELSSLSNWNGVVLVLSGHIHNPSPMTIATSMQDGGDCQLFYVGCPTRPTFDQGKYDHVYYANFLYNIQEGFTDWKAEMIELDPASEVFYSDDVFIEAEEEPTEEQVMEEERKENLHNIIREVTKSRMVTADPISQVENFPHASDGAKEICKLYINRANESINARGN